MITTYDYLAGEGDAEEGAEHDGIGDRNGGLDGAPRANTQGPWQEMEAVAARFWRAWLATDRFASFGADTVNAELLAPLSAAFCSVVAELVSMDTATGPMMPGVTWR